MKLVANSCRRHAYRSLVGCETCNLQERVGVLVLRIAYLAAHLIADAPVPRRTKVEECRIELRMLGVKALNNIAGQNEVLPAHVLVNGGAGIECENRVAARRRSTA